MFPLICQKFGFAGRNSLRFQIFKRRADTAELYRSLWHRHVEKRISPHVTGIHSWRAPAFRAFILIAVIISLCFGNALLLENNIILPHFDRIPIQNISNRDYRALWQAHAAIISIAFIGIVFLYEFISDEDTTQFGAQVVVTDIQAVQIISFSVLANGVMAVSTVLLPPDGAVGSNADTVLFGTFRGGVPTLFLVTLVFVLFLYGRISSIILDEGIGNAVERRGLTGIDEIVDSNKPQDIELEMLQQHISEYPENQYLPGLIGTRIQGDAVNKDGEISDFNLKRLQQVFHLANSLGANIIVAPRLGDELGQRTLLAVDKDLHQIEEALFSHLLEKAIITRESTRWNNV